VNEFQAVPEFPNVWAAGDCTAVLDDKTGTSHPPNAQHGLREGLIAAKNIEATILGKRMKPFTFTLRVLQEGQFEKLGEDRTRTVDVRIIAATNRDVAAEVKAGRFRQDLYYRLSVLPHRASPTSSTLDDIPTLGAHFLAESARKLGLNPPQLTSAQIKELQS